RRVGRAGPPWPPALLTAGRPAVSERGRDRRRELLEVLRLVEDRVEKQEPRARRDHLAQTLHAFIARPPHRDFLRHLRPTVERPEPLREPLTRPLPVRVDRDVHALADREGSRITA